jgi:hypothetical protein
MSVCHQAQRVLCQDGNAAQLFIALVLPVA